MKIFGLIVDSSAQFSLSFKLSPGAKPFTDENDNLISTKMNMKINSFFI